MYFNKPYIRQEFLTLLQTKIFPNFVRQESPLQLNRKTAYFFDNGIYKLGTVTLDQDIHVLEIKQKSSKDPRITLTKDAFKILDDNGINNALVIFYSPDTSSYRLSLLTTKYINWDEKTNSSYKRYSYILGPGEKTKTPEKQLLHPVKDYQDLVSRFDVEVVRKDFFEKYLELYVRLYKEIKKEASFAQLLESQQVDLVSFTKNLLGKIVFIYFIQQKGWLGLGKKETEYGKGNKNFMRLMRDNFENSNESMSTEKTGYFYNDYLERLFFEGLNKDKRDSDDWFPNLQMKVPYLNGGLFKEDYQGRDSYKTKISNDIFSNATKKGDEADGILDIFDRYNFTVDEDSLYDSDIAVDPEMLGRIFEKMISISHENIDKVVELYDTKGEKSKIDFGKELNKKLGAFYTPREIVHYMTKESLIAYLINNIKGDKANSEKLIRALFELKEKFLLHKDDITKYGFDEQILDTLGSIIEQIDSALKKVKILDPAVGSGAFPMGLLHEISSIRYYIYGVFYKAFGVDIDGYKNTGGKISLYKIKREIILNNIYGVDIDPGAIDIARLRFWLSLVVDEEQPEPLPNFEFKFVCANTLISLAQPTIEDKNNENDFFGIKIENETFKIQQKELKLETLKKYKREYYNTSSNREKIQLKEKIRNYAQINTTLFTEPTPRTKQISEFGRNFDNNKHSHSFFDPSLMMSEWRGYDIVIGNPPYIKEKGNEKIFQEVAKGELGKYYTRWMDYYYFFFHLALNLLKDNGVGSYITTNYFLSSEGGKKLRMDLYDRSNIIEIVNFNNIKIFENALGQHNSITMLLKNNKKSYKTNISVVNKAGQGYSQLLQSILRGTNNNTKYLVINKEQLFEGNEYYIRLGEEKFFDKMVKEGTPLQDFCNINQGLVSGANKVSNEHLKKYPDINAKKGDGIYILTSEEVHGLKLSEREKQLYLRPFFKNSNIQKYYTSDINNYRVLFVRDTGYPIILEGGLKNHFDKYKDIIYNCKANFLKNAVARGIVEKRFRNGNWFVLFNPKQNYNYSGEKILLPQISNANSFGYNTTDRYGASDIFFITLKKDIDIVKLKFILALLNSKLFHYWLYNKGKRKGDNIELTCKQLSQIPIKLISIASQQLFINLVDQILARKKENPDADTSNLEKEIDQMVYGLYGLSDEEVRVVEESLKR